MPLLDQYGKEIKANKPILEPVAVQTIRDRYSSYPSQGLTPERLAAILKEADQGYVLRQAELAEEIEEKDGHLGSVLQSRKLAVAGLTWEVLPASESAEDKKIAEAGKEMLDYIGSTDPHEEGFEGAVIDSLDGLFKGFAVQEIMWEIAEGQVWAKSLEWIHQKRFTFSGPQTTVGNQTLWPLLNIPRLLTDAEPIYGDELLPNKFVFHRHKARSGATSRGGLLRACVYMYLFKNYDIKDWLVFNDLFSVPMRVGKYKSGASPADIDALKTAVFNLGVDAAAVISDSTVIELLEAATRTNAGGFKELAEYCEKTQTKVVLGHSSAADSTPGKLGNEQQGQDLQQNLLESDAKQIERTVRFQILGPWKTYNYGPNASIPKFKMHYEADEDLASLAETYGKLVTSVGFTGIPVSHVHERFGIPEPKDGEKTIVPPQPANPFAGLMPSAPGQKTAATSPDDVPPVDESGAAKELQTTQASVLNGAQITAATAIVMAVANGEIPRDAGLGQLQVLFNLTPQQAEQLMGTAGTAQFKQAASPEPPAPIDKQPPPDKQQNKLCSCGVDHHSALRTPHSELELMLNALEGADAAWVSEYMKRLEPSLHGAKQSALNEIERWLAELTEPPTAEEFNAKIQQILGDAYAKMDRQTVDNTVADMYRYYKNSLPLANVSTYFGGADARAMEWLAENDNQFYSKFIKNPESQDALTQFLNDRYLQGGEGLFGRGDPKVIAELKALLGEKLTDISGFQANRIVDTSVQRIRNFAHLEKMASAGIPEVEIYEPTEECAFCASMNGRVIQVATAYGRMQEILDMTPDEYVESMQQTPDKVDNLEALQNSGAMPPYHPHCHGRPIMRIQKNRSDVGSRRLQPAPIITVPVHLTFHGSGGNKKIVSRDAEGNVLKTWESSPSNED
ncbi:MAG: DUF935 family protein [Nitrospirota bacterium]